MDAAFFASTDAAVARANGSREPEIVAEKNHIIIGDPLRGTIIGLSMRYSYFGAVAVNISLIEPWHSFALWHELGHIFRGHVDDPSFNYHQDRSLFTSPVDSPVIPRQEKEANLISAEYTLDTEELLDLIGYHTPTMRDYRALKKKQGELLRSCDALRGSLSRDHPSNTLRFRLAECGRALRTLEERMRDLESDMISMTCVKSISEIAGELGTDAVILKYKLEALRMRGFDIDLQELERYDQVFRDAR